MPVKSEKMGKSMKYARAGLQFHALHIDSDKLTPPCLCLRSVINRPLFSTYRKRSSHFPFFGLEMFIFLINFLHLFNKKVHKLRLDFRVFSTHFYLVQKNFSLNENSITEKKVWGGDLVYFKTEIQCMQCCIQVRIQEMGKNCIALATSPYHDIFLIFFVVTHYRS